MSTVEKTAGNPQTGEAGKRISSTDFVKAAWSVTSYEALATKLGMEKASSDQRFASYRKRGVKMPKYAHAGTGARLDVSELNKLVESLSDAESGTEATK